MALVRAIWGEFWLVGALLWTAAGVVALVDMRRQRLGRSVAGLATVGMSLMVGAAIVGMALR